MAAQRIGIKLTGRPDTARVVFADGTWADVDTRRARRAGGTAELSDSDVEAAVGWWQRDQRPRPGQPGGVPARPGGSPPPAKDPRVGSVTRDIPTVIEPRGALGVRGRPVATLDKDPGLDEIEIRWSGLAGRGRSWVVTRRQLAASLERQAKQQVACEAFAAGNTRAIAGVRRRHGRYVVWGV